MKKMIDILTTSVIQFTPMAMQNQEDIPLFQLIWQAPNEHASIVDLSSHTLQELAQLQISVVLTVISGDTFAMYVNLYQQNETMPVYSPGPIMAV